MFGLRAKIRREAESMLNSQPVNPKSSRGSRVRYQANEDGGKKRLAVDGTELGVVRKTK
jgi:hypothetical protein